MVCVFRTDTRRAQYENLRSQRTKLMSRLGHRSDGWIANLHPFSIIEADKRKVLGHLDSKFANGLECRKSDAIV
ncbi:hypothetical protein BLJ79_08795 [Arthrobacter sp. UCD-GKA]|nr:hypothetical protein BLJ79_08795 [Arthrobacter sp. UCD-GKA]